MACLPNAQSVPALVSETLIVKHARRTLSACARMRADVRHVAEGTSSLGDARQRYQESQRGA